MQIEACLNPDRTSRRRASTFQVGDKNLTFPANLHFLGPTRFRLSLADRPIDEPADVPRSEFPGWAGLSGLGHATSNLPAGSSIFITSIFHGRQKKQLPLNMHRNLPPSLFEALNRPERCSQELRHLLLGLLQFLPKRMELFVVHGCPSFGEELIKIGAHNFFI
jgi:hypothetical protein